MITTSLCKNIAYSALSIREFLIYQQISVVPHHWSLILVIFNYFQNLKLNKLKYI